MNWAAWGPRPCPEACWWAAYALRVHECEHGRAHRLRHRLNVIGSRRRPPVAFRGEEMTKSLVSVGGGGPARSSLGSWLAPVGVRSPARCWRSCWPRRVEGGQLVETDAVQLARRRAARRRAGTPAGGRCGRSQSRCGGSARSASAVGAVQQLILRVGCPPWEYWSLADHVSSGGRAGRPARRRRGNLSTRSRKPLEVDGHQVVRLDAGGVLDRLQRQLVAAVGVGGVDLVDAVTGDGGRTDGAAATAAR